MCNDVEDVDLAKRAIAAKADGRWMEFVHGLGEDEMCVIEGIESMLDLRSHVNDEVDDFKRFWTTGVS